LFQQVFGGAEANGTEGEDKSTSTNSGKLVKRMPVSKSEVGIERQSLASMKLATPEIFKEKTFINEGTFGKVYRAKIGDDLFALKKIKVDNSERGFPITSIREIKVLKKLADHPNIVKLVDIVRSKS
jgi:serine/threonine protein kinase